MDISKSTITITFGDQGENHVGMQKIGAIVDEGCGFNYNDLLIAKGHFEKLKIACELINLHDYLPESLDRSEIAPAFILIARNAVEDSVSLFAELSVLDVDKKALMYKRVVNKKARYNLCFSDIDQEPKYEEGKGRIVSYDSVPLLNALRITLPQVIGEKAENMIAEGNFYYDTTKCGIGWHGDTERRKVIAIRLGKSMNICYQWYLRNSKIGAKAEFMLNSGDMYIMSEKATGCDWKKQKIYTLRHSAGCEKYTE